MSDGATLNQQQLLRNQYQQLHNLLSHARETCSDSDLRDRLREQEENVDALMTAMDQAEIGSRTGDFDGLTKQIQSVNADLGKLKDDIATIGRDVAIFGKVVGGINSAISTATKLLA